MGSWEYPSAIGLNVARGITPVVTNWDTDPTNLGNVTDGDTVSETGEGVFALGGAGNGGQLALDLGRAVSGLVLLFMDAKISAASALLSLSQYDGSAWGYSSPDLVTITDVAYRNKPTLAVFIRFASEIKFNWYLSGAATLTAKYFELVVLEQFL